jgi:LPXTG-motif cell wall-anchored protein
MTEDFILEENEDGDSGERRPFLIAVGVLAAIGILSVVGIAIVLMTRDAQPSNRQEIAAIETRNAEIAVTNEAVTRVVAAMETEAARPTETLEPTSTPQSTAIPTNTPRPTNTPVVRQAEEDEATPDSSGSSSLGTGGATPTPIAALGSGDGSLPQTGIGTWAATIAAVVLLAVLFAARRLRSS